MGEEFAEQILGQDADIALDLVVENQTRRDGRFVLAAAPPPPAFV